MINYLPSADEVQTINGKSIHLFNVPAQAVKEVLIGAKSSTSNRDLLIQHVRGAAPHASIKQVRFDPRSGFTAVQL